MSNALTHYLRESKLLFIYAPYILLYLLLLWQSYALSEPAKSTNESFPIN